MRSPYCVPWWCALCGGRAEVSVKDAHHLLTSEFFHKDPRVCRDILAQKERENAKERPEPVS